MSLSQKNFIHLNTQWVEDCSVKCGLKQGRLLSSFLFNLFINDLCFDICASCTGINISDSKVCSFLHAEYLILLDESEQGTQNILTMLDRWCTKWGVNINEKKSKVMHIRQKRWLLQVFIVVIWMCSWLIHKYLGLLLNEYLDMSVIVKDVAQATHSALGLLIAKVKFNGGLPLPVYILSCVTV